MSLRNEQCRKVCRIIDDFLANRPTERNSLIVAVQKAFKSLERLESASPNCSEFPNNWIPCSETVDIPDHEILACDKYGEEMFGYLAYEDEQWLCESDGYMMYDPIAWREKPEPYKPESEE